MTHLSLFSGIGGIDLAAHWAGFRTIQFVEREPFCQRVLAKNFPGIPIHDDVTTFDATKHTGVDLVSAGFPCQPHSLAGKRLASGDERDLWSEVVRTLGEAQPRWFLGENVSGLLTSESGRFFGRVVNDLVQLGYRVGWGCFPASFAGADHQRYRIFIVAYAGSFDINTKGVEYSKIVIQRGERSEIWGKNRIGIELGIESVAPSKWRARGATIPRSLLIRSDDGFSTKLDTPRLKALGNAVVPQQVYPILEAIAKQINK